MERKDEWFHAAAGITFILGIFLIFPLWPELDVFYHHLVRQRNELSWL
jgi:hypothetical protein